MKSENSGISALLVLTAVFFVCGGSPQYAVAQELYVSLYGPNPDYLEVTLDTRRTPSNTFVDAVKFEVVFTNRQGQRRTRLFLFSNRSLRPGVYKNYVAHGQRAVRSARGGTFDYAIAAAGDKADDPGRRVQGKAKSGLFKQSAQALSASPPTYAAIFKRPQYRLDYCLHWGKQCGMPAANRFCRDRGFRGAKSFVIAKDIGAKTPTLVLGDGKVCNKTSCDGFARIECQY